MAFKEVLLNEELGMWIAKQSTKEIEDTDFIISIHGYKFTLSSHLRRSDKDEPATLILSTQYFIAYLSDHQMTDVAANTVLFRSIIEGIKRLFEKKWVGSFTIAIQTTSVHFVKDQVPRNHLGGHFVFTENPSPLFSLPETEYLLVKR